MQPAFLKHVCNSDFFHENSTNEFTVKIAKKRKSNYGTSEVIAAQKYANLVELKNVVT